VIIMKKNKICLKMSLIAAGIFLCSTIAYAAPPYTSANGAALTVGTAGAGNDPAVITFNPSPGVSMGVYTSTSAYSLNALNTSITAGDANEYLVLSTKAGYYQKQMATNTLTTLTATAQSTTNYTYMGGGS
jgi:hypothetical protein